MTPLPACDAAYALFHEIAAWIDDVTAGVRDFDDFADTVAGRLIPVADAARDEARAMGEALLQFADGGTQADLKPTVDGRLSANELHGWFSRYLERIDRAVRETACAALPASPAPTKESQ